MKSKILIGLVLVGLTSNIACKKKSTETANSPIGSSNVDLTPIKNDRLVLYLGNNPETLNPVLATTANANSVISYIFDRLISYDVKTGEPQPKLAESWKISPDGKTYTFKIRPNAFFHDGTPVTAEDVKFSFDIIKNPKVDAAHLQNYYAFLDSVTVKGPYEVEFKMKEIYYRNLIMVGLNDIIPKHIYGVGDFNRNEANRFPIGSGPYKFSKWDAGRSVELKLFDKYWGSTDPQWKDKYNFKEILMRIISDDAVAVMAMKKGDIDTMDPTPTMWLQDFADPSYEKKFYKIKYSTDDGAGYRYIGWNSKLPKFASKNIRRALSMALPREEINTKLFKNLLNLSVGPFPKASSKTDPSITPLAYDLNKAKEILAAEGWKDSNKDGVLDKDGQKFSFELLFAAGRPEYERIALIYQQSLKEIGVEMNIRTLEWTVFVKQLQEWKFDAVFLAWSAALDGDPYQVWHSSQSKKGGSNYVGFSNARVDELITKARSTLDRDERNKLYQEFTKIVADENPYTFVFELPHLALIDRRFEGVLPVGKLGLDSAQWFTPKGREKFKESSQ